MNRRLYLVYLSSLSPQRSVQSGPTIGAFFMRYGEQGFEWLLLVKIDAHAAISAP